MRGRPPNYGFPQIQGYARYWRIDNIAVTCSSSTYMQMRLPCRPLIDALNVNEPIIDVTAAFHSTYVVKIRSQGFLGRLMELVACT